MGKKYAVIGLGQFGTAIAKTLSSRNAEVIAIDKNIDKVENIKDAVSYTVSIDATNKEALMGQNIQDMDCVIIAIGENFHSAILCANILVELGVKRIIGRAMGENERLILEKLGINEIISPEDELGFRITESILNPNIIFSISLPDSYLIVELKAPKKICEEKLGDIKLREDFGLNLITILVSFISSNFISLLLETKTCFFLPSIRSFSSHSKQMASSEILFKVPSWLP